MKKLLSTFIVFLVIISGSGMNSVHAENIHNLNPKESKQVSDNFMLNLFNYKISEAVSNYYKEEVGTPGSINLIYDWTNKNYDVVNIQQFEQGQSIKHSYIVQFTVIPQKNGNLGTDTITFGVDPNEKGTLNVKMLKYKHNTPQK